MKLWLENPRRFRSNYPQAPRLGPADEITCDSAQLFMICSGPSSEEGDRPARPLAFLASIFVIADSGNEITGFQEVTFSVFSHYKQHISDYNS